MAFVKWLRYLIYIAIISTIMSLLSSFKLMPHSPFFIWIFTYGGWFFSAITIYCLFRLSCVNNRYKKASIYRLFNLVCIIARSFSLRMISNVSVSSIISLATLLFSIIATYQECTAHAEIVVERDALLSRRLRQLFYLNLVFNIILPTVMTLVNPTLSNETRSILIVIFGTLTTLLRVIYLRRMVAVFSVEVE